MIAALCVVGFFALFAVIKVVYSEEYPGERQARRKRHDRMAKERARRALNTGRAKDHMASQGFRPPTDYATCPPRVVMDAQGRRWQQVDLDTHEPIRYGDHAGAAPTISAHLQRMLSDD